LHLLILYILRLKDLSLITSILVFSTCNGQGSLELAKEQGLKQGLEQD